MVIIVGLSFLTVTPLSEPGKCYIFVYFDVKKKKVSNEKNHSEIIRSVFCSHVYIRGESALFWCSVYFLSKCERQTEKRHIFCQSKGILGTLFIFCVYFGIQSLYNSKYVEWVNYVCTLTNCGIKSFGNSDFNDSVFFSVSPAVCQVRVDSHRWCFTCRELGLKSGSFIVKENILYQVSLFCVYKASELLVLLKLPLLKVFKPCDDIQATLLLWGSSLNGSHISAVWQNRLQRTNMRCTLQTLYHVDVHNKRLLFDTIKETYSICFYVVLKYLFLKSDAKLNFFSA